MSHRGATAAAIATAITMTWAVINTAHGATPFHQLAQGDHDGAYFGIQARADRDGGSTHAGGAINLGLEIEPAENHPAIRPALELGYTDSGHANGSFQAAGAARIEATERVYGLVRAGYTHKGSRGAFGELGAGANVTKGFRIESTVQLRPDTEAVGVGITQAF